MTDQTWSDKDRMTEFPLLIKELAGDPCEKT